MRACVFISPLFDNEYNEDLQEILCKDEAKERGIKISNVYNNFQDLLENTYSYDAVFIYSYACLGDTFKIVMDRIQELKERKYNLIIVSVLEENEFFLEFLTLPKGINGDGNDENFKSNMMIAFAIINSKYLLIRERRKNRYNYLKDNIYK